MKFTLFFFLILLARCEEEEAQEQLFCKREIPESYGINGFLLPRTSKLFLCPLIDRSCCSNFDQILVHKQWHEVVKVKIELKRSKYQMQMQELYDLLSFIKSIDVQEIISKINQSQTFKSNLFEQY